MTDENKDGGKDQRDKSEAGHGVDSRYADLVVLFGLIALVALMSYLANSLTYASHILDCLTAGRLRCG